jgi:hypothetical protein
MKLSFGIKLPKETELGKINFDSVKCDTGHGSLELTAMWIICI